jgi:histone H2B
MGKTKNTTTSAAPSSDAPKPAGKAPAAAAPAAGKTGGARRRRPDTSSYNVYIYRVLKNQNKDIGITKKSMNVMNQFCQDVFERVCTEAGRLARYNKRSTISSKEIQTAVLLCVPGELGKHSMSQGTAAVTKFNASSK